MSARTRPAEGAPTERSRVDTRRQAGNHPTTARTTTYLPLSRDLLKMSGQNSCNMGSTTPVNHPFWPIGSWRAARPRPPLDRNL